ncbi:hypothetical protein ACOME3_001131 [Neoechinorhynchus agilis]
MTFRSVRVVDPTGRCHVLNVSSSADELKRRLPSPFSTNPDDFYFVEPNTDDASVLHLVPKVSGGAKKRKKKQYSTPKKTKHKHKKVKLAVLKYYEVKDGKVVRLRRECTSASCGAGVFMANHFDRQYCGKCTLTYMLDTGKAISGKKETSEA